MLRGSFVLILALSTAAHSGPSSPADCVAPGVSASGSDELSGSTYTWVRDTGGMAPSAGAVVRLDFYGGHADISATSGAGDPTVWAGEYTISGGNITIAVKGEGIDVHATNQPFKRSGDDLTLPFGLTKGTSSVWHRSQQKLVTRIVRAACIATPETGNLKPQCLPPNGNNTFSFGKDCLFWDTTLDGKLLQHRQQCVVTCDVAQAAPGNMGCGSCFSSLENGVAFSSFHGLPDDVQKQLAGLYGKLVTAARSTSNAQCVAEAKLAQAEANQDKVLSGHATAAEEDAATHAVSVARAALSSLPDDTANTRKQLEEQIVDLTLARMIPYQKRCGFDAAPSLKFHYMGTYSAPIQPDTSCALPGNDPYSPTQLVAISGGDHEQQVYDSLFYKRDRKTGAIRAERYESAAAALLHEGFHHTQFGCGEGFGTSDLVRALILEATEVMTYALSSSLPFYQFMLSSKERDEWTVDGAKDNAEMFDRNWRGVYWCAKSHQELKRDGPPPSPAERKEAATFMWQAYGWMQFHMKIRPDSIWVTACDPGQVFGSCKNVNVMDDAAQQAYRKKLYDAKCH